MKKRRSTVYVRPGKDVTLYVPAETPAEVIDYLNELKQEGTFSQGVIDIVTQYVQQRQLGPYPTNSEDIQSDPVVETSPLYDDERRNELSHTEVVRGPIPEPTPPFTPEPIPVGNLEAVNDKLDVAQIFRQAQRNAGKMNVHTSG